MRIKKNFNHYVLLVSKKAISLVKWQDQTLNEVRDGVFPVSFKDDYEYSRSSRGTSFGYALKNFEKDKSIIKKERFKQFLRDVNKKLKGYLNPDSTLFLVGTDHDRSDFKRISDYNNCIGGEISGSYNASRLPQLKKPLSRLLVYSS
jgi:hypothetical protein